MSSEGNLKSTLTEMEELDKRISEIEKRLEQKKKDSLAAERNLKSCEKRISELEFQADEDKNNCNQMQDIVNELEGNARSYKVLVDATEELAALNMAKVTQTQKAIEAAQERFNKSGAVNIIRKHE